jgi:recombination protein RecR
MPSSIERLETLFARLPGIGPRQARRFVYFLLGEKTGLADEMAVILARLRDEISQCPSCRRFFPRVAGSNPCTICLDNLRDQSLLMIVEKDVDLESVERAGVFRGTYFVLGGLLPILEKNPHTRIRLGDLDRLITQKIKTEKLEIVLALSANLEGDHTAEFLEEHLREKFSEKLTISFLGRGLSTGTELEYSDRDTLLYALKNRGSR